MQKLPCGYVSLEEPQLPMLETKVQARGRVYTAEYLPSTHKAVGSIPSTGRVGRQIFMQTGLKLAANLILKSGQ